MTQYQEQAILRSMTPMEVCMHYAERGNTLAAIEVERLQKESTLSYERPKKNLDDLLKLFKGNK